MPLHITAEQDAAMRAHGLADTRHTLTLKVRAEHNPDSTGNWTRIGYLLTNPPTQTAR